MVSPVGNAAIRDRLQTALRAALRARDKTAASALRSALAAIDNASAVPAESAPGTASGPHFAGAAAAEAAAVAAFWRDLGLPGLADIHTHFMPPNVLAKVWAFFEGGRAGVGRAWPIAYRLPEEERVPASISPTSRIPTCTSWKRWAAWASARRGCGRFATTTPCGCSACERGRGLPGSGLT